MQLEFELDKDRKEMLGLLGFNEFLHSFEEEMPLLPYKKISLMKKESGISYWKSLEQLKSKIEKKKERNFLENMIAQASKLPFLDHLLPAFKDKTLEQAHLFLLGEFLQEELILLGMEEDFSLFKKKSDAFFLHKMNTLIHQYLKNDFSNFNTNKQTQKQLQEIQDIEEEFSKELQSLERKIFEDTGLKMIYPYPKEVSVKQVKKSPYLEYKKNRGLPQVEIKLPPALLQLNKKKEKLLKAYQAQIQKYLIEINKELSPYYDLFSYHYAQRKERVFQFIILQVSKRENYSLPNISHESSFFSFKEARLPSLAKQKEQNYIPLNISCNKGSHVIFGSNMTGKTTVLKTLFFHLIALQIGLPVPATELTLSYPGEVQLLLKSSGNLKQNLSSFGEELHFFAKSFSEGDIVMIDELFQTTNPISGAELSKIFLDYFSQKNLVFFCTSQYPEVLSRPRLGLFRMKEAGNASSAFTLEKMTASQVKKRDQLHEIKRPMELALDFPLPSELKNQIRNALKSEGNKKGKG